MAEAVVTWDEILEDCAGFREGFVRRFRKYEGQPTDEKDGQGRAVKVTIASFARHAGIAERTFRDWTKEDQNGGTRRPASTNGTKTAARPPSLARRIALEPERWDLLKSRAEDSGSSSEALAGRVLDDYLDTDSLPYTVTDEERTAYVEPIIDSCGVDNSFNELVEMLTNWLDSAISTLSTEEERNVLTRLLKRKLNQLQATKLKKYSKGTLK